MSPGRLEASGHPSGNGAVRPHGRARSLRLPDPRLVWLVVVRYRLALWFLAIDLWYVVPGLRALAEFHPGSNATLYAAAARAWLNGADPWQVTEFGIRFAAPPPTLLLYAPFAFSPPFVTAAFWLVADLLALAFVIRRLHLAWWWALFPPIWEGLLDGSPETVVLACLVATGPLIQALAPLLKVYAIAPLVGERRWRAVAITLLALGLTAIVLPWTLFLADLPLVSSTLADQAANLSAYSVPLLLPVGLLGLAALGARRAGWLAVPVLWPHTQLHYATMTLPVMTPLLAVGFSLPIPGASAVAVAGQAVFERWRTRRERGSLPGRTG